MSIKNEKKQILDMVKENKITPEQGVELLDALGESNDTISLSNNTPKGNGNKFLRIKVDEADEKVNINVPIALVGVALKLAEKYVKPEDRGSLKGIDINEIVELIESGAEGKILDVKSSDGTTVEIFIDEK